MGSGLHLITRCRAIEALGYGKAKAEALSHQARAARCRQRLRDERGMLVIMTAQQRAVVRVEDPTMLAYDTRAT